MKTRDWAILAVAAVGGWYVYTKYVKPAADTADAIGPAEKSISDGVQNASNALSDLLHPGAIGQNADGSYIYPAPSSGGMSWNPITNPLGGGILDTISNAISSVIPAASTLPATYDGPAGAIGQNADGSYIYPQSGGYSAASVSSAPIAPSFSSIFGSAAQWSYVNSVLPGMEWKYNAGSFPLPMNLLPSWFSIPTGAIGVNIYGSPVFLGDNGYTTSPPPIYAGGKFQGYADDPAAYGGYQATQPDIKGY